MISTDTTIQSALTRVIQSAPLSNFMVAVERSNVTHCRGIAGSLLAVTVAHLFDRRGSQVLLIVPDDDRAEQLRDDFALIAGEISVRFFGRAGGHKAKLLDMSGTVARVETLKALAEKQNVIVVSSATALAASVPPAGVFDQRRIEIEIGKETPFAPLVQKLADMSFERKDFVEDVGDFAVRGGILDVYPFVGDHPVRIEFWGDRVESIREFEVLSQRSIRNLEKASIVADLKMEREENGGASEAEDRISLLEYLQPAATVFVEEQSLAAAEIDELRLESEEDLFNWNELRKRMEPLTCVFHSNIDSPHGAVEFGSTRQPAFNGSIRRLKEEIAGLASKGFDVLLTSDTKEEAKRLEELLEEEEETPKQGQNRKTPIFLPETLHSGFILPAARTALFTEHEIFGRLRQRGPQKKVRFKGFTAKEVAQLKRGDFVVHADFGVGRFDGLRKIKVRGAEQEALKILYENDDAIYVNLNYVNRVQKYSSKEGHVPKVTKLGTAEWDRLKSRVRKRVKDIARDLISLYARRKAEPGFAFGRDTHWQKEMEASFMYEDTPDQAKASLDVKMDMESPSPMDRLICGDVGFGKTEVAVRAAFKAVMDGKQVAVLVPTTILARQHVLTFKDRLDRYGVRIESLSRLRSPKEQKAIVLRLKSGDVDIVIGTHRLLSKDIAFKNLGLLVVDEEHRFGVSAKEKLRQLRASVDTVTLTATPIPRTLQFSLMGARDLSLIQTPPRNRLPIISEIAQFDLKLIREAILHEVHRGGQVYFIHDRVHNIDEVEAMLARTVPDARMAVAHGQMDGKELERVMMEFLERKYDVLLCTKIIESGIDIPSVNTILVNRADRFGLAELYQLRGRVGRSNVQAFAYMLTPPIESLPKQTIRRLQALQEFTELGSGFNLAMRDLEIRGAGNVLGAEQSGFILEMGFEMYMKIVEEAVGEAREEQRMAVGSKEYGLGTMEKDVQRRLDVSVESDISALIPDFYVESDAERLDIYRRMSLITEEAEVQALRTELQDRFGEFPEEVEHMCSLVELKLAAARLGVRGVELDGDRLVVTLPTQEDSGFYEAPEGKTSRFQSIMNMAAGMKKEQVRLKQEGKALRLEATVKPAREPKDRVTMAKEIVGRLSEK